MNPSQRRSPSFHLTDRADTMTLKLRLNRFGYPGRFFRKTLIYARRNRIREKRKFCSERAQSAELQRRERHGEAVGAEDSRQRNGLYNEAPISGDVSRSAEIWV